MSGTHHTTVTALWGVYSILDQTATNWKSRYAEMNKDRQEYLKQLEKANPHWNVAFVSTNPL